MDIKSARKTFEKEKRRTSRKKKNLKAKTNPAKIQQNRSAGRKKKSEHRKCEQNRVSKWAERQTNKQTKQPKR